MSLAAAARANNLSQLNTVTEIKYSSRNSTARDHSMIAARDEICSSWSCAEFWHGTGFRQGQP